MWSLCIKGATGPRVRGTREVAWNGPHSRRPSRQTPISSLGWGIRIDPVCFLKEVTEWPQRCLSACGAGICSAVLLSFCSANNCWAPTVCHAWCCCSRDGSHMPCPFQPICVVTKTEGHDVVWCRPTRWPPASPGWDVASPNWVVLEI